MEKLSVISIKNENGSLTGWIKDNPSITAEGSNHVELMSKLIEAVKIVSEIGKK
jgi:hypothetical protein